MAYYFEDFEIGQEFISPGRTITESDVMAFAGLSGDYNQLHTNTEFCSRTLFGKPIAHGLLGLSVTSGLLSRLGLAEGTTIAFLGLTWDFTGPIFFGDTVYARATIKEKRETSKNDRGIVIRQVELINQHGKTVQKGDMKVMVRRKPE
ncbi:MAG: MaoC family dehydratase N-terminal domain-containing protein [Dethiobacter sp.]|jgi:acyl dehydratase|nr:MaoC family dehydratase N-terminal domain-containing protein [Dethiobacter sp.]